MDFETKNESGTHQPHDKIVKKLLSNPETAKDILSLYLPEEILNITNLDQLELQRDSFIDDEHRANAVDLLYKTKFKEAEGYIYVLVEHQRQSDYWMPLRLFKYIGLIWDHIRISGKSKTLPLIYPIVLYNGNKPYSHSLNLMDLIEPESSKTIFKHLFTTPFTLIDLPSTKDEALRETMQSRVKGMALLMTLKHVYDRNLQTFLNHTLIEVLQSLDRRGDKDEIIAIITYLLGQNEFLDETQFWVNLNHKFSEKTEKTMPTIADKIEARGYQRGHEEGIERGMEQGIEQGFEKGLEKGMELIAQKLLSEKTSLSEPDLVNFAHRLTGLSIERIRELKNEKQE